MGPGQGGLAPDAGRHESIVYLGFNNDKHARKIEGDAVRKYAAKNNDMAAILTGNGENDADQGILRWTDHRTGEEVVHDLNTVGGLQGYLKFLGIDKAREGEDKKAGEKRMDKIVDLFYGVSKDGVRSGGYEPEVRDEMGQLLEVLQHVENGYMDMDRLILSGHSNGHHLYSEEGDKGQPGTTFRDIAALMSLFPKAQSGVEDIMFSACHTHEQYGQIDNRNGRLGQMIAPNAKLMWGYDGKSPAAADAAKHVLKFLEATESGKSADDAGSAARRAGHAATVHKYR